MKGVNNNTAISEPRASALNNENYSLQRAPRCINFECLWNIGKGEVVTAICKSSIQAIQDLLSGLNPYIFSTTVDWVYVTLF